MADYPISQIDIAHKRGDSFDRTLMVPFDISSGYSLWMEIRDNYMGSKVYASIDTANGGITISGYDTNTANTAVSLSIPNTVTQNFKVGKLHYDVQWTDPLGKVRTICEGLFTVSGDVTR